MFNLLTQEAKNGVKKEYSMRLAIFACLMAAAELIIATTGGALSYYGILKTEDDIKKEEQSSVEILESSIKEVSEAKERIAKASSKFSAEVSPAIIELVSIRPSGIKLTSFDALFLQEESAWQIRAVGVADTRDSLALFEEKLKKDRKFIDATIPLESFAKDANAQFTITLKYKEIL